MGLMFWLAVFLSVKCEVESTLTKKPNIIFFLVDDMGWNDVGFHGLTQIPTRNIDALANNSIILNNYYTHPACSPSRSALMSGMYATTTGLQHQVIQDPQRVGLPLGLKTMPEALKELGYVTHMLGKWHLGFYKKEYTPTYRGFDHFYGFWPGETDQFFHVSGEDRNRSDMYGVACYETRQEIPFGGLTSRDDSRRCFREVDNSGKYLAYVYTDRAKEIIRKHNTRKPLFLYYAHHGVHRGNPALPVRAPKPLVDLFKNIPNDTRANFSGAVTAIDLSLGELMVSLQRKKMLENTIIVFSSDNGTPLPGSTYNGGSNYPLRGGKLTGWEGGVRANGYVWYNKFKYSGLFEGLMHISDWMPTLYKAAGGRKDIVAKYGLEGKDMWDAIFENGTSPRPNIVLQNDSIDDYTVYRSGDFKLVLGQVPKNGSNDHYGDSGREPPPSDYPNTVPKTETVLRKFYRRVGKEFKTTGPVVQVKCLDESVNVPCSYSPDTPCLYNIKDDPCEQVNLAETDPDTVTRLQEELKQMTGIPPNYPQGDYASNPAFYKGYWSTWADENYNYNYTSC